MQTPLEAPYYPEGHDLTHDPFNKYPDEHLVHLFGPEQTEHPESHTRHLPSSKYFPSTQPGLHEVSDNMNPSLHPPHEFKSPVVQVVQAELHFLQVLVVVSPYNPSPQVLTHELFNKNVDE